MSLRPEARGFIDTEERRPSGEGPAFDAGNEQDVRSCLPSSPKESAPRHAEASPRDGVFGTDFWHAVEFSRNGRAPVRVSRPVVGQPIHAMSNAAPLSKRIRCGHSALPGRVTTRVTVLREVSTARPRNASGSPWSAYETKNVCCPRQMAGTGPEAQPEEAVSTPARLRRPRRSTSHLPCRSASGAGTLSGSSTRWL